MALLAARLGQGAAMDVADWLRALGLERYEATFRENDVTGDLLHQLTAEDLKELGVATVGHRRRLLAAIAGFQGDVAADQAVRSTATPGSLGEDAVSQGGE